MASRNRFFDGRPACRGEVQPGTCRLAGTAGTKQTFSGEAWPGGRVGVSWLAGKLDGKQAAEPPKHNQASMAI